MKKITDFLKNIAIALLLCSILLLGLLALPGNLSDPLWLERPFSEYFRLPEGKLAPSQEAIQADFALPLVISVNRSVGRTSIHRDEAAVKQAYEQLGGFLADALTSAAEESAVTDLRALAGKTGVLFTYGGTMPADALALWLGGGTTALTRSGFCYLLALEQDAVVLYAAGTEGCSRYKTTVSAAALLTAISRYIPDGSTLAGEQESSSLHPLTLWENAVQLPAYGTSNPLWDGYAAELAVALDFNPYGAGSYTEADGTTVFTEGARILSIAPDGSVSFSAAEENYVRFTAESEAAADLAELARQLVELVLPATSGDGYLQFCGTQQDAERTVLSFCWCLDGTAVFPSCAQAVFSGPVLQEFTCRLQSFRKQPGVLTAMPAEQAAAIAADGAMLLPAYRLPVSGIPVAGWKEVS